MFPVGRLKNLNIYARQLVKLCIRSNSTETDLRKALAKVIPCVQDRVKAFKKESGTHVISQVTVNSLYAGLRGINALICETSQLDDEHGIRYRGLTIHELQQCLPKACGGEQPLPEGVFWLLCTGEIPNKEQVKFVSNEWAERAALPCHVVALLNNFPKSLHPMAQLSCAVTALNHDSKFLKAYNEGVPKKHYWEFVYEDSMDLIAKLPVIAATIYVNTYKEGKGNFAVDCDADWSANFTRMLGYKDPQFTELMRLYMSIHADHEGGNVSAHTVHLVGSALSDPYLSFSAGLNGLAGPLHGLANQEVLKWMEKLKAAVGNSPTDEKVTEYVKNTLKSGHVVPGFGHAALRITDPRYTILKEFAQKYLPNDQLVQLSAKVLKIVPKLLQETGKVKNPWPNVDGHSGAVLQYYGMKEMNFYTVLFGVSRALGTMAQLIWDRAFHLPIERPRSWTSDNLKLLVQKQQAVQSKTPKATAKPAGKAA